MSIILIAFQGFTNFMPRFAIRTTCNLLDAEIVKIRNEEEAHTVYGIYDQNLPLFVDEITRFQVGRR